MDNLEYYETLLKLKSKINENGCWIWQGASTGGYGYVQNKGVHRVSYETFIGEIPEGHLVCHHCDTPLCVNPNHLFTGTHQDNMDDMKKKKRNLNQGIHMRNPEHINRMIYKNPAQTDHFKNIMSSEQNPAKRDDVRKKISQGKKGRNNPMAKKVIVNDQTFDTLKEASLKLGVTPAAISYRIKKGWEGYAFSRE